MKFANLNLFPLTLVNANWTQYYVDKDFNVYSTKQSPVPKKLIGSANTYRFTTDRTYTLNGTSVSHTRIKALAKSHESFAKETSPTNMSFDSPVITTVTNRKHATTTRSGLSSKGWIIGTVAEHDGVEHLQFGSKPKIHLTQESVKSEMERLALSKPGTTFVSFKVDKQVTAGAVSWS